MKLNCQRCGSDEKVKNGIIKGLQKYQCKRCTYRYSKGNNKEEKNKIKRNALELYLKELGFRLIRKILNYIKSLGEKIEKLRNTDSMKVVEIDELYRSKSQYGFGLLLLKAFLQQ